MSFVESPKEQIPPFDYIRSPVVLFDGEDGLLCYENANQSLVNITIVRFAGAISIKVLPINSEYINEYGYPLKHFVFNEVFGADETKRWEPLAARLWAISFNDLIVEVVFSGAVTVEGAEMANATVDALVRARYVS